MQDTNAKYLYGMCAFFLVYIFSSPYNFRWYVFEEAIGTGWDKVRDDIQPYTMIAGFFFTSIVLART